jgi:uncharacterized protein (TIGR03083 family)
MDDTQGTTEAALAYSQALRDFLAFVAELPDSEWSRPTDLPGWTVQDVISHVAGVEADLLGRPSHPHVPDYGTLPHAQDPFAQYVEVAVDVRRSWSPEQVRADLLEVLDDRIVLLAAGEVETQGPAASFFGSVDRMLVMRPFDVWVHEQDLRRATGRPGNLDGAGARVTARSIRSMLPYVVGKRVRPEPGTSVRWVVTGELPFTDTVVVDGDRRARLDDDFVGEPTVTLSTGWSTFAMIASGRADATTPAIAGDTDLADRVLDAMTVTP